MDKLKKAEQFAWKRHKSHKDDLGKPYFHHLEQVAGILKEVTMDVDVLSAGYLHDTLEDTETTYDELKEKFGYRVADLVNEVTHEKREKGNGYYFPRLKTREGILIKFADRLSNLSRMENWSEERKNHYLKKSKFWDSQE